MALGMLTAQHGAKLRDIAVIIPAYQPETTLLSLASEMSTIGFRSLVIVDDGSRAACAPIFTDLSRRDGVHVIHHATNQGKGAALKSGIRYALREMPDLLGVVTADADGQHSPHDIRNLGLALSRYPHSLILGSRVFEGKVPFRSRFGNTFTRYVVHLLVGTHLMDTQTGLRAIPAGFAESLLALTSSGYDFELDMLIAARNDSIAIREERIETIYDPGNRSSHFDPLVDSMKIYFVLARFCSVAVATAVLDNIVFYVVYRSGRSLLGAQLAGRGAAVLFNYLMVREKVFHARDRHSIAIPKYLALVVGSGSVSYGFIRLATAASQTPVLLAKILVESLLFFVNFAIERDWIFVHSRGSKRSGRAAVDAL